MFKINDRLMFVEIKEADSTKRLVFPVEDSLVDKINSLGKNPNLVVSNVGHATVTEVIPYAPLAPEQALQSIPSMITGIYTLQFVSHPDVTHGSGRYSEEFVEYLKKEDVKPLVVEMTQVAQVADPVILSHQPVTLATKPIPAIFNLPTAPPKSLTEQLKSQLPESSPAAQTPVVSKLPSLEEMTKKAREEKGADKLPGSFDQQELFPHGASFIVSEELQATIIETLRVVKSIERAYNGEQKEVVGRDLAKWFNDYSYQHGADAAWTYIATKISEW
jgi:hypothetical protein